MLLDCEHKTPAAVPDGYPYLAIPDLVDGRIDLSNARRITEADFSEWTKKTKPQAGDVIVTRRGRVGDSAVVPEGLECAIGQNLVILRSDDTQVRQDYLRWVVRGPLWRQQVDKFLNVGAVFNSLNCRDIPLFEIPVPPLPEQRAIVVVLGALDDKIELNRRMNETLDKLCLTLFRSVATPRENGEGWLQASIADLASYVNGRNFTKDASGRGRMVIRITELNSGPGPSTVWNDVEAPSEHVANPGDILFSWSGSLGIYRWTGDEALINQHIFKVIPNGWPAWFVYYHLREVLPFFRDIAADKATTMGHIKREHLREAKVWLPPLAVIAAIGKQIEPAFSLIAANDVESRTLVDLRDTLLPKLISGEIHIRDAERTVEQAT